MQVDVTRENGSLARERWVFAILDFPSVVLDAYHREHRATTRHRWRPEGSWHRLSFGRQYATKTLQRPEVPDDVIAEAIHKYSYALVFKDAK